jgi:predicted ATPase
VTKRSEDAVYRCGRFEIDIVRRELRSGGDAVAIGSRAFDVLGLLVRSSGRLVAKSELMDKVWPATTVSENTLHVHIAAVRKAFGSDRDLLETLVGQGYRLAGVWPPSSPAGDSADHYYAMAVRPLSVGPLRNQTSDAKTSEHAATGKPVMTLIAAMATGVARTHNLPSRMAHPVGRDAAVHAITMRALTDRFVSVTGIGGIGKTTAAVTAAYALLEAFEDAACFVDLGPVSDSSVAAYAVASALGLTVRTDDPIPGIIAFLRDRRMLLILDSCEHLVDALAEIAERIYLSAPGVHIVVTSREALRVEGERVYQLSALEFPTKRDALTATEALQFSAVQCFVQRAAAGDIAFALSDSDAPAVAEICRALDGIPLAIEFAAGRVAAFGIQEIARLLKGQSHLYLSEAARAAPSRHHTLAAALEWSHSLLSDAERIVLRRLSVFKGFLAGLEPAVAVAAGKELGEIDVVNAIAGLVEKSLVTATLNGPVMRYRLLDMTRAYASEKLAASGEARVVAQRHANWLRDSLARDNADPPDNAESAASTDQVDNVRAALEWSFGESDRELATALAAEAAPLFLRLSLLSECHRWMELAIAALDQQSHGTRREMGLQASLGVSLMFTKGNTESVRETFGRSLTVAEAIGCLDRQVQILGLLNIFYLRLGDYHMAQSFGERANAAAEQAADQTGIAAMNGLIGSNLNLLGHNAEALHCLTEALRNKGPEIRRSAIHLGYNYRGHALISLALTLWFSGFVDQAVQVAAQTIEEAAKTHHPAGICLSLLYAASVLMWARDYERVEHHIDAFMEHAQRNSLTPYLASGYGMKGELAVVHGRAQEGVTALRRSLKALRQDRYSMRTVIFSTSVAEGLRLLGRFDEALDTIEAEMQRAERFGDLVGMPEMLRVKGETLISMDGSDYRKAETVLLQSLELASSQSSLSLELRTAMSLARLWSRMGMPQAAIQVLASVYDRFTEGFGTVDLQAAKCLLEDLERENPVGTRSASI